MLAAALTSFLVLAAPSPPPGAAPPPPPSFARCEELAVERPESEATARCFDEAGDALKQTDRATARLRELLQQHPGSPWPTLFIAYQDASHAEELSRAAASGFAARGDAKGEVLARLNLYRLLFKAGRVDEAGAQADQTVQVAAASGNPELLARARVLKARHLWGSGKDLAGAYLLLRQAEPGLFPNGSYFAQKEYLLGLANLSLELGRYREGLDAFRRLAELAAGNRDGFGEATARYGMARAVLDETAELPNEEGRREVARLARQALDAATTAKHLGIQAKAHFLLGILSKGEEARRHFDACLTVADNARDQSTCLNGRARLLAATDLREAETTIDRSRELARQADDP